MTFLRALLGASALAAFLFFAGSGASTQALERVEIVTKSGVHVFDVELANTPDERSKGLMFRRELPQGRGMLFDFGGEGPISMWMKNTFIPLDMLFIRADGTIARIAQNTTPQSEETIPSGAPVKAVLEVIGGTAKRLGIAPGDRVAHRIFRSR
jgi:uncharacterized protein